MEEQIIRVTIYAQMTGIAGDDSICEQIQTCRDYVLSIFDGDYVISEFEDKILGDDLNQSSKQQMLLQQPDFIVVDSIKHISRDIIEFSELTQRLEQEGTILFCVKERFNTATPLGKALTNIAKVFAQSEREQPNTTNA